MGAVGINFGSATSGAGFNVETTVASIVSNLQQVENPWNTGLTTLKADDTALTSIGSNLASLSSSLAALTDFEGVMVQKEGSSSNTSLVTLSSANATATAGNHTIVTSRLAQTASDYTDPIPYNDTIGGALTIQVGSAAAATVPIVSGVSDTLSTYAAAINFADVGVTASVVSDTSGSRLSLVSRTSGAAGALTISQGGVTPVVTGSVDSAAITAPTATVPASNTFTLPSTTSQISGTLSYAVGTETASTVDLGTTPLSLTDAAAALNADTGFAASGLTASITSGSLVITGATDATGTATIDTTASALTFITPSITYPALADVTTPAKTLNINTGLAAQDALLNVDGVNIQSASNTVSTAIPGVTFQLLSSSTIPVQVTIANANSSIESAFTNFVSAYNTVLSSLTAQEGKTATGTAEPLYGNPIIAHLQSALSLALTTGSASGSIKSLAQLGITVSNTGTLSLNSSTLDSALNTHYSDIVGFLQNAGSFGLSLGNTLGNLGSSIPNGSVTLALRSDSSQETTYNDDITRENALIATQKASLTSELNAANEILQAIPQQLNEMNELYSALTGFNTGSH